jgi:drug/metabolite transporter (DMT)-like permease
VATRLVVHDLGPVSLALLRYAVALGCLWPAMLVSAKGVRISKRDVIAISILGAVQFGIVIALLNVGLRFITSARAALIFAASPLITMALSAALRHEPLTVAKTAGVSVSFAGVGVVLGERALMRDDPAAWIGEACIVGSAVCAAACAVFYRSYTRRYPALAVGATSMAAAVAFLAVLALREGFFSALPPISGATWLIVLLTGLSSGVSYYLWLWALTELTATHVAVFLGLSPLTAAALGAVFLAEPLSVGFALGLGAVLTGLWLSHRPPGAAPAD